MLRTLKSLLVLPLTAIKPLLLPRRAPLLPVPCFHFCAIKQHPIIESLLEVADEEELEGLLINITKLNDINKRLALQILLQRIEEGIFPPALLLNEKLVTHLKKFPDLHIESLLFRIGKELTELQKMIQKGQEEGKKIAVKDINRCYAIIFDIVKRIPRSDALELEIKIYQSFANYHFSFLLRLVEPNKTREVLKKSLDFYKSALSKVVAQIEREQEKESMLSKEEKVMEKVTEETELTQQKIDSIENTHEFKLFFSTEKYCELLYEVMKVQNYLTDARIKDTIRPRSKLDLPFEYHEGLYDLIPSFTRALEYFKSDEVKLESNYYFKIKKTCLELQHYEKLHQNKNNSAFLTKELKSFAAKMEELSEQIATTIISIPFDEESIAVYENLTVVLLGIKCNKLTRMELNLHDFEAQLVKEVKQILSLFQHEDLKKLIAGKFCHAIKTIMNLDFEKHLGKMPRSARRSGKRNRTQE